MNEIKGVSRTRDKRGRVVRRTLKDYVNCLHSSSGGGTMACYVAVRVEDSNMKNIVCIDGAFYSIRKLTPRECFRLMGVNEENITQIQLSGICKTRQYKLSGNSIVVDVIRCIFTSLFKDQLMATSITSPGESAKHNKEGEIELASQLSSSQNSRAINSKGISYAMTNGHRNGMPEIVEPLTCALRGRNLDNPSLRKSGMPMQQRLEIGGNISNCITSVQKDSLVAEPVIKQIGNILPTKGFANPQRGRVYSVNGISPCIHTCGGGGQEIKIAVSVKAENKGEL